LDSSLDGYSSVSIRDPYIGVGVAVNAGPNETGVGIVRDYVSVNFGKYRGKLVF
jgi:hypothetical protein